MENQESRTEIILGVDTHLDIHLGVVLDAAGHVLGTLSVGTHNDGYKQLLCWAQTFGLLRRAGVEGTGSYGAALTHVLQSSASLITENANGLPSRPMAGSRMFWRFVSSACGDYKSPMPSSSSFAWR